MTGCLMHQFDKCIGVELLESLHRIAVDMKQVYSDQFCGKLDSKEYKDLFNYDTPPTFEVYQADML